ncbi:MAG: hydrogenase iron-sulfur subunit [Candidatus Firestonebacteria bacterium]|nr:hydrogenase iron-sulfur subunit [Candidatus Firestonebacteria bacterium]
MDTENIDIIKDNNEIKEENKSGAWEPKIYGFLCNWCSYEGADLAGSSRRIYPSNIRIIRVPCSGRIDPLFILKSFEHGADGVLVSGCHPGDCHYSEGNYFARRKFVLIKKLLEFVGIEPERFQARWISASEAVKFVETIKEMTEKIRKLGPNQKLLKKMIIE